MTENDTSTSGTERPVPPSRVVAALSHNPNVRKGEVRDDAVRLYLTNTGIGNTVLQHLRSLGYEIVSISPRFGTVRCLPTNSSVVAPGYDSTAVEYHRSRLITDGGTVNDDAQQSLFDERDRATFEAAIEEWGIDAQADMAEEEAAEFIVASKHYARGKIDADELIDELADIRIMQEQLSLFIGKERVESRVSGKMDRLRERLWEAGRDV